MFLYERRELEGVLELDSMRIYVYVAGPAPSVSAYSR